MFLISSFVLIITAGWLFLRYIYSYWERKGFPFIKPTIPMGNLSDVAKGKSSFGISITDLYNQNPTEPYEGMYLLFKPALLVRDADFVRDILQKDFSSFHDRGIYCNEVHDPISATLFSMSGERWRTLRAKLTPAFTSGKLKNMFPTILAEGEKLNDYVAIQAERGSVLEVKDLMARYAVDIIASVIFGITVNSVENPDNEFRNMERNLNADRGLKGIISLIGVFLCPKLLVYLRMSGTPENVTSYIMRIVKEIIEYRESNNVSRKDLMQLLIQIRNTGNTNVDGEWNVKSVKEEEKTMSIEMCAAQLFLFYIAGMDTSASAISFSLYEISKNKTLLQKVRDDIDATLKKHDGQITYESIKDMKYVDLVLSESVRKYPGLPILNRECTKEYHIPNTNHVIEKGTSIIIPLLGIMRDPKYFPDPEGFDPERFLEENKNYTPAAYFPFGEGPRACIGIRMGKIVTKIAMVKMLMNFNFELTDDKPFEFLTNTVTLAPKGGINLRVTKRSQLQAK